MVDVLRIVDAVASAVEATKRQPTGFLRLVTPPPCISFHIFYLNRYKIDMIDIKIDMKPWCTVLIGVVKGEWSVQAIKIGWNKPVSTKKSSITALPINTLAEL